MSRIIPYLEGGAHMVAEWDRIHHQGRAYQSKEGMSKLGNEAKLWRNDMLRENSIR